MSEIEPTIPVPEAGAHASVPEALAQAGTVVTAEDRARRRRQLARIEMDFKTIFGHDVHDPAPPAPEVGCPTSEVGPAK